MKAFAFGFMTNRARAACNQRNGVPASASGWWFESVAAGLLRTKGALRGCGELGFAPGGAPTCRVRAPAVR